MIEIYYLTQSSKSFDKKIDGLKVDLYPHQKKSIHVLDKLGKKKTFSIHLHDKCGYGKTLTALSYVQHLKNTFNNDYFKVVVVCGSHITHQWFEESKKTSLKCVYFKRLTMKKFKTTLDNNVFILTPGQYKNVVKIIKPSLVIIDEYDSIKFTIKNFTERLIFLSATSNFSEIKKKTILQNDLAIIKSDSNFLETSYRMKSYKIINIKYRHTISDEIFKNILPIKAYEIYDSGNVEAALKMVSKDTIYLGDDKNYITYYIEYLKKCLNENESQIVKMKNLIENIESKDVNNLSEIDNSDLKRYKSILKSNIKSKSKHESKIKRINELLQNDFKKKQLIDPIMYENIKIPVLVHCCFNYFEAETLHKWLNDHDTCPYCRSKISKSSLVSISFNSEIESKSISSEVKNIKKKLNLDEIFNSKDEAVYSIIESKKNESHVIYSTTEFKFHDLCEEFNKREITHKILRGHTLSSTLEEFRNGNFTVLLSESFQKGAGINLEFVDNIHIYGEMNDHIKTQVIGRGLRIGREKNLNVFVYKGY